MLLRKVTEKMASLSEISEHTWGLVRTVMLRDATNAATTKQPYLQASEWEQRATNLSARTSQEWLDALQATTRESISGVHRKLLSSCYAEALLQGNVAEDSGMSEAPTAHVEECGPGASLPGRIAFTCAHC